MKKILFLLISCLLIACDGVNKNNSMILGTNMRNVYEKEFTQVQLDSICNNDSLPTELNKWHKTVYQDFENGRNITQYTFIKKLGKIQDIYCVEKLDSTYRVTRRITSE